VGPTHAVCTHLESRFSEAVTVSKITGEIPIWKPVDVVFDFVVDERNEPLHNPVLLHSDKVTDGPVGVGTRFHAAHKSARRPVEMNVEIISFDRPRRMASRTTMSWAEIDGALAFESVGNPTKIRWDWNVHTKGVANLLRPLVGVVGRRSEKACWEGLKRYLEAYEHPSSAMLQARIRDRMCLLELIHPVRHFGRSRACALDADVPAPPWCRLGI
jgi:Polyketide cyclase / dehydrase and lipid transport